MEYVIELRKDSIHIVAGKASRKRISVKKAVKLDLPSSLIENNEVIYDDTLITLIKTFLKSQGLRITSATIIINDRNTLSRNFSIPKVDKKRKMNLVKNEMISLFNLSKDYIIDYRDIPSYTSTQNTEQVIASALSFQLLASLERFFKALHIKVRSVESSTSSFIRLVDTFELVNLQDVTIVVDVSGSYIRSYLFDHMDFILFRSFFIQDDSSYEEVSARLFQILDVLRQKHAGKYGSSVSKIILLGERKRHSIIQNRYADMKDITVCTPDLSNFVKTSNHDILEYASALGGFI